MSDLYRILIVDDEDLNRLLLSEMLDEAGDYHIDQAADGQQAWARVQSTHYDLVITDIRMPQMSGIELLELVKAYNPSIPVIVVTAFASIETAVRAMQKGAANFLKKPFSMEEICSVTLKALKAVEQTRIQSKTLADLSKTFSVVTKSNHSVIDPIFHHIRDLAKNFGFSDEQLHMNLYLSLSEAIANAIDHGNKGNPDKNISIEAAVNNDAITIEVEDEGEGFNVNHVPDPTADSNIMKSRGRGIFLMRCYMDSVSYENNGKKVKMIITPRKSTDPEPVHQNV